MTRKLWAFTLCLLMAVAFMPASAFADSGKVTTEKDSSGKYYTKINIDPYTYYDVGGGAKQKLDEALLEQVVKKNLLYNWVDIANGCFRTAGDCATAKSADYAYCFNNGNAKEDCYGEIRPYLRGEWPNEKDHNPKIKGTRSGYDNLRMTGLIRLSSLSQAREKMASEISEGLDGTVVWESPDFYLKRGPKNPKTQEASALDEMNNDKDDTVFCSIVTSSEIGAASSEFYRYSSFGICFYDFHPRAIQGDGLEYVTAADGYDTPEQAVEKGAPGVTYTPPSTSNKFAVGATNYGKEQASQSISCADNESATVTNNYSEASSLSFGESLNLNFKWGSATNFFWTGHMGSGELALEFDFNQDYRSSEGHGWSETRRVEHPSSLSATMEPQTSQLLTQETTDSAVSVDYDTPVEISYKVAAFAMTGTNMDNELNNDHYGCYFNQIGTDKNEYGISANENLYQRAIYTRSHPSLDTAYGAPVHRFWNGSYGYDTLNEGVDWNHGFMKDDGPTKWAIENQAKNCPMLSCGCSYSVSHKTVHFKAGELVPLYLPKRFLLKTGENSYEMSPGDTMDLDRQLEIACENKNGVPYYGFSQRDGKWVTCDQNGTKTDSDAAVEISSNGINHQIMTAKQPGTGYITWKMNDDITYKADKEPGSVEAENSLEKPIIKVDVKTVPFTGSVKVSGDFDGCVGDQDMNLNKMLTVTVYDKTGKQVSKPVDWEARELESAGIAVKDNGDITLTKAGTFHVRAVVRNTGSGAKDICSDWYEITAKPARVLSGIEFDEASAAALKEIQMESPQGATHTVYLGTYVRGYDQYGEPWKGDLPEIEYGLGETTDTAKLDGDKLILTGEGDFEVTASLPGMANTGKKLTVSTQVARTPQSLTAKNRTVSVKSGKLKKKAVKVPGIKVTGAKTGLTYAKVSGSKKLSVDSKTGRIIVKKGTKKGKYTIKIKAKAGKTDKYQSAEVIGRVTVRVK